MGPVKFNYQFLYSTHLLVNGEMAMNRILILLITLILISAASSGCFHTTKPSNPHCDQLYAQQISCSYPWHSFYAQCVGTASDGHVYEWKHWWSQGTASQWEVSQTRCR